MSVSKDPGVGGDSPWGRIQSVKHVVNDSIVWVSTASHGGFWLSDSFHWSLQNRHAFKTFAGGQWYEEDCDASVVVVCYCDCFDSDEVDWAMTCIESRPSYYGRVFDWLLGLRSRVSAVPYRIQPDRRGGRRKSAKQIAAESCGLVKVRGALGGTYYE